ncbi:copper resistance protein CopC [Arthrobacter sp. JZ12]|uniref:copper resistance protein CopC n=1 Tax=Arthrobacter sp. JZ12 TaxID=2654190 RepID=UPI002B46F625|nr:copper resistance protein CopC [Arthrobacter sp. JZ12]WRH23797.1 copper resistance protein CopC [Arthrobacter sp. JZ12]
MSTSRYPLTSALPVAQQFRQAFVSVVGAMLAALCLLLGFASPASAHDELTSSNPEAGESLETVPEAIELTFNNVPATIGSQVQILDESGEDWAEGEVSITDTVASQPIRAGAPAGTYTVNWRVVSSDSHPIEGTFEFSASGGSVASETPAASAGTAGPIETADAEASDPEEAAADAGVSWAVILMIAVLIALAVVLALGARRRLKQGNQDAV